MRVLATHIRRQWRCDSVCQGIDGTKCTVKIDGNGAITFNITGSGFSRQVNFYTGEIVLYDATEKKRVSTFKASS